MVELNTDNRFDIDLKFGQETEKYFKDLFYDNINRVEVKTEHTIWQKTKNLFIEIFDKSRNKPTGIRTTESEWWLQAFRDNESKEHIFSLLVPTNILKDILGKLEADPVLVKKYLKENAGDRGGATDGYAIPVERIIKELLNYKIKNEEANDNKR
jgi:hypothetical protein